MAVPDVAALPLSEKGYGTYSSGSWWAAVEDEDTPELRWPLSVPVFDRMRKQDSQVLSVLRAVTLPIRRTPWRIDQAGAKSRVTQLISEDLGLPILGRKPKPLPRTKDRFSWGEHLRLALLQLTFGHAYFEQQYRIVNGLARLRKLGYRPPRTIAHFEVAADGGLKWIEQFPLGPGENKIDISRLVAYVNDREGGNWVGQSLLRPAYGPWLLKQKAMRTQAVSFDRNGNGVPIYTTSEPPEGLTADDVIARQEAEMVAGSKLAQAYRGGENAGAALPWGAKLEFPGVQGKTPDIEKGLRWYDEQIGRAVLAHFLSLGGENSNGSYALGETFESFFTLSLQTVAMQIADVATQHVVEDLVDANFGPDEPAPKVVFDEIGSRHPATAEAIMALVQCGALTPDAELERHLRTQYALPDADPGSSRAAAVPPAPAAGDNPQTPAEAAQ